MKNTNKLGHTVKKEFYVYHGETVTTYVCKKCTIEHINLQNYCYKCGNQLVLPSYKEPFTFYNSELPRNSFISMEEAVKSIHDGSPVRHIEKLYEKYCEQLYAVDSNGLEIAYEDYIALEENS
jgi:hypothetical protein